MDKLDIQPGWNVSFDLNNLPYQPGYYTPHTIMIDHDAYDPNNKADVERGAVHWRLNDPFEIENPMTMEQAYYEIQDRVKQVRAQVPSAKIAQYGLPAQFTHDATGLKYDIMTKAAFGLRETVDYLMPVCRLRNPTYNMSADLRCIENSVDMNGDGQETVPLIDYRWAEDIYPESKRAVIPFSLLTTQLRRIFRRTNRVYVWHCDAYNHPGQTVLTPQQAEKDQIKFLNQLRRTFP